MVRSLVSLVTSVLVVLASVRAMAQPAPPPGAPGTEPEAALELKIAVWRFDALGIEAELVGRLETLFRMELARLSKVPLPSRRDIERAVTADQQNCTGEEKCLAAIGKRLGVDVVVTGTVGAMGESYVLNIKAVSVKDAKQMERISSDPLRGSPDELIDGVRVAAYRLLAPSQLHGSLQIQTDLVGAEVRLDGQPVGKTPLPGQGVIGKLAIGKHQLSVSAKGYDPFDEAITVNFQKVTQVNVRLLPSTEVIGTGAIQTVERKPIYTRTWFIVGVLVGAALLGAAIGNSVGKVECIDGMSGEPRPC